MLGPGSIIGIEIEAGPEVIPALESLGWEVFCFGLGPRPTYVRKSEKPGVPLALTEEDVAEVRGIFGVKSARAFRLVSNAKKLV